MRRAAALLLALAFAAPAAAAEDPLPAGHTKIFVGQTSIRYADDFARETGREPLGGMWYAAAYQDPSPVLGEIARAVATHPGLEVSLGLSLGSVSTPEAPRTALIAAGAYDAQLAALADGIRALPTTVFLRIGYEFDLLGGQYGPAETYKVAYRHIVDVLRARGVRNAVYVWHSAGAFWRGDSSLLGQARGDYGMPIPDADPQPIAAFYPGRDYVDAFGISYWGDTCCFGRSGPAARALYEQRTRTILDQAKALGLPLTISESTPANVGAGNGGDSVAWVNGAFDLIEAYDIRLWSLIAMDWQESGFFSQPFWNGYWPDARIGRFAPTRAAFLTRSAQPRYLFRDAG
ncbi:MAG: hypothetical protein JWM73_17 [Solirubrobacterales bacterium]|nr:hypothetical protein [Solirubrobacterales bacterium]